MKAAILVNGVPASGKSTVARVISKEGAWPLLTLDTIKEAFFNHLGTGDRIYNRTLGKASYEAIFALIADFPHESVTVVDAWFGFQPLETLDQHMARAGIGKAVEVWCNAAPEEIGARYLSRVSRRPGGHLGADYVPELIDLARRANPTGRFPLIDVDTSTPEAAKGIVAQIREMLARSSV